MVTNVVGPLVTYMDRFLIGGLLTMAAVGYYAAPYEAITKAGVFPASLVATLFPAFSSMEAVGARKRLEELYARSVKFLLLTLGPGLLLVTVFAHEILRLWLGSDFAQKSTSVLQILSVGVLINSLALVPYSLLQGLGRPDVTAKFHLLELPVYFGLMLPLISRMGIAGAAVAWTLRAVLDAVFLFGASCWLRLVPFRLLAENGLLKSVLGVSAFAASLCLSGLTGTPGWIQVMLAAFLLSLFGLGAWSYVLDGGDRMFVTSVAGQLIRAIGRAK